MTATLKRKKKKKGIRKGEEPKILIILFIPTVCLYGLFIRLFLSCIVFSDSVASAAGTDDVIIRGCDAAADERAGVVLVPSSRWCRHHIGVRGF